MKNLLTALALTLSINAVADETYSSKTTTICQLTIESAAIRNNLPMTSYKIKGVSYVDSGNYSEFIVKIRGELGIAKCATNTKGELVYLKLGEIIVIGSEK